MPPILPKAGRGLFYHLNYQLFQLATIVVTWKNRSELVRNQTSNKLKEESDDVVVADHEHQEKE